jgi:hypothetical protein
MLFPLAFSDVFTITITVLYLISPLQIFFFIALFLRKLNKMNAISLMNVMIQG